jgi:hypothetical protein
MVDIERARQRLAARARKHPASFDPDRLARLRAHGVKGKRQHVSAAALKHIEAKLDRLRAAGSVKGVRRVPKAIGDG